MIFIYRLSKYDVGKCKWNVELHEVCERLAACSGKIAVFEDLKNDLHGAKIISHLIGHKVVNQLKKGQYVEFFQVFMVLLCI